MKEKNLLNRILQNTACPTGFWGRIILRGMNRFHAPLAEWAVEMVEWEPAWSVLDVGCGGGFPGIPLAILFPLVKFTLVDSIGKKINVVNNVISALGITNAKGINGRAENMTDRYDFIISRAVTAFPDFVDLTGKLISKKQRNAIPNGIIYLKGGDFADEIKRFQKVIEIYDIIRYFEEPYFETKKIIYLPL